MKSLRSGNFKTWVGITATLGTIGRRCLDAGGYSSQVLEEKAKSYGVRCFAMKPPTRQSIAATSIREVLDEVNKR